MRRRAFLALLGAAAALRPLAARAQQAASCRPSDSWARARRRPAAMGRRLCAAAARTRLDRGPQRRDRVSLGGGRSERFAEIAAEFVRLKVDVIVTAGRVRVLAAKQATSVIPIVFALAHDPVGSGLVASLARPGGNVTGLSNQISRSCRQAARTLARGCSRSSPLAIMANVGNPIAVLEMSEVQATARTLGLEVATSKSGERKISRPPSRRSRAGRTPFMSVPTRS